MKYVKVYGCDACWSASNYCQKCENTPGHVYSWQRESDVDAAECPLRVGQYAAEYEPPREVPDAPAEQCDDRLDDYVTCTRNKGHVGYHFNGAKGWGDTPVEPTPLEAARKVYTDACLQVEAAYAARERSKAAFNKAQTEHVRLAGAYTEVCLRRDTAQSAYRKLMLEEKP